MLANFPDLKRDDILAASEFGARGVGGRVVPLSAGANFLTDAPARAPSANDQR